MVAVSDSSPSVDQRGSSLIEVCLAIMLIGISVLALTGLLYTIIASSSSHRATVRSANRAAEVAEAVEDLTYIGCPSASNPSSALYKSVLDVDASRKFDEQIVGVEYLADRSVSNSTWLSSCPTSDQGAQRVTVKVTTRQRPVVSSTVVLIKRDRTCPTQGMTEDGLC